MRQILGRSPLASGLLLAACLLTTAAEAQSGGSEGLSPTLDGKPDRAVFATARSLPFLSL